jgi:hypothetical protein
MALFILMAIVSIFEIRMDCQAKARGCRVSRNVDDESGRVKIVSRKHARLALLAWRAGTAKIAKKK